MNKLMKKANSLGELYNQISVRKRPFFITFAVIVTLSYAVLFAIDFIPEPVDSPDIQPLPATAELGFTEELEVIVAAWPEKIIFDALGGREVPILNPQSRDIASLDAELLKGAVRHPDSADFQNEGNIFILGHSSYLPNVLNRNFQAFNGVQNLKWGDRIRLVSEDTEYIYRVERVYEAKASEVVVPHTPGEARLTLATCDSFGSQDDRFIVEAVLVGQSPVL